MEMYEENDEQRQMRRVAFFAIVVSTVAVIASIVTLPMLYNYVQSFQSHLIVESDFCKVRRSYILFESSFFVLAHLFVAFKIMLILAVSHNHGFWMNLSKKSYFSKIFLFAYF